MSDNATLVERLNADAINTSRVSKMMADDKSRRNGHEPGAYMWSTPEQTVSGQAAARIAELEAERDRLKAELKGLADLWPAAPTSFGTTTEWDAGFVAGLEAFRASIRRTIAERSET